MPLVLCQVEPGWGARGHRLCWLRAWAVVWCSPVQGSLAHGNRVTWVSAPKATFSVCLQMRGRAGRGLGLLEVQVGRLPGGQRGLQWVSAWDPGPVAACLALGRSGARGRHSQGMLSGVSRTGAFFLGGLPWAILSGAEDRGCQAGRQVWVGPRGHGAVLGQFLAASPWASPAVLAASLVREGAGGCEAALGPPGCL